MNGFFDTDAASQVAMWVAALVTLVVLGGLLGEKRLFGWSQHLLAGLATGFLAVLAITEVIVPRVIEPLGREPAIRVDLWLALVVVGVAAAVPWLPRVGAAIPLSITVGAVAAFALGGAVIGTLLPQTSAAVVRQGTDPMSMLAGAGGAAISGLVLLTFLHGTPRGRVLGVAAGAGRWLMLAGLGGWIGYLLFARLLLLVDRVGFLLRDWLGIVS